MSAKGKLPPELEMKNAQDFHEYSKKIEDGLEWMEKNLSKLSLNKVSISTLSKRTGIHRNTLSNSDGRGAYVIPRIKRLKALKKQKASTSDADLASNDSQKEPNKIEKLEMQLELQRKETGKQFLRLESLKQKLNEAESALKRLANQNLLLQEENERLLEHSSRKVVSIAKKIKEK